MGSCSGPRLLRVVAWFLCFVAICNATLVTREVALNAGSELHNQPHISILAEVASKTVAKNSTLTVEHHVRAKHPPDWRSMHHQTLISEVSLNHQRVGFSQDGRPQIPMWNRNARLDTTTMTKKNSLLISITFHEHLASTIRDSNIGFIILRRHNASVTDANAGSFKLLNDTLRLWLELEFGQLGRVASAPLAPGLYTMTLQLDNPYLQEPFSLYIGDIELLPPRSQPFRLADLWNGSLLDKFLQRCTSDPTFEPLLATRMLWGELLVSLFSVSYCMAVTWLGPLDFTNWQLRAYQLSCVTGICFQLIFLGWCASAITTELAFPLALSIALIYFSAFNVTNMLILLERDDAFPEADFSHIQYYQQQQQRAALRMLLHAKRARWC